ncbi:MAG: hypothetical protein IPH20_21820 [Bacteroidales bacterium]|nr:hypothetical protein [Bacteroidales bacterium]
MMALTRQGDKDGTREQWKDGTMEGWNDGRMEDEPSWASGLNPDKNQMYPIASFLFLKSIPIFQNQITN